MPKVVWSPENDRKLLIRLIERSAKAYDTVELAKLFDGATPKAIEERIAKLKREAKAAGSGPDTGKKSEKRKLGAGEGGAKAKKTKVSASGKKGKFREEDDDSDELLTVKSEEMKSESDCA
ncbi:hypothetical protein FPQ18DRAFT_310786 [Pyronema domesticum]|uniref:Uncharacterized protein n=1 Tax=Pyronema omphalodes (strain CBS 100304) TaxID=1076935 RepID=U4LWS6_PYROM|nr:hypothetical protein FPQ18DRAFT_310786 [Pyronema domesticum]CCX34038.1 Similar to hypothetical protein AOL_s00215g245 [Arthrobotrys oligospora ATCC 24927]; acc. no. EGX43509 [Pyronema omphalodes CBS 100304]